MADAATIHYSIFEWFQVLGLGAAVGSAGQMVRTIVGLKKVGDAAATQNVALSDLIQANRLVVSLVIGAVAGVFAAPSILTNLTNIPIEQIFAIAASGYAGADVIEGLTKRVSGSASTPSGDAAIGVGGATPAAAPAADGAMG